MLNIQSQDGSSDGVRRPVPPPAEMVANYVSSSLIYGSACKLCYYGPIYLSLLTHQSLQPVSLSGGIGSKAILTIFSVSGAFGGLLAAGLNSIGPVSSTIDAGWCVHTSLFIVNPGIE